MDAALKIYSENQTNHVSKVAQHIKGLRNLYKGMWMYSFSYTTFVAIEFSLFESMLVYVETLQNALHKDEVRSSDMKAKDHSFLNISIASFLAGAISGFLTNSIEFLAVNI